MSEQCQFCGNFYDEAGHFCYPVYRDEQQRTKPMAQSEAMEAVYSGLKVYTQKEMDEKIAELQKENAQLKQRVSSWMVQEAYSANRLQIATSALKNILTNREIDEVIEYIAKEALARIEGKNE